MSETEELLELEEQGWIALSSGGSAAVDFYGSLLADDALMIFPGGIQLHGKNSILEAMSGPPWESFELHDQQVVRLSADTCAVVYQATAQRRDCRVYRATISSIYVRESAGWKLAFHQQSPV